jgi:NADH-quinone oxidoreductase subunit M
VYSLVLVERAFYGPARSPFRESPKGRDDLSPRELAMVVSLAVLLVGLGLYPQPVIDAALAPVQAVEAVFRDAAAHSISVGGGATP